VNYGLNNEVILKIQQVFAQFPEIEKAILYGSRAKGTFKPGSDIDLTLISTHIDFNRLNIIKTSLDELNLPYTFDLSLQEEIENKNLLDHIQRVGIVFYVKSK
jgi:predicted nucleotidyltransferase